MKRRDAWLLAAVLAIAAVLSLRAIGDPSVGYPDADRLLMDGVFIRDFIASFDWLHPFESASRYYAQYPALSIGYRVPGYPFLIAMAQLVLGVNVWSARLVELALWLVALSCWFRLVQRGWGTPVAATAGLLLGTTPFVAQWAWFTMTELPVLSWSLIAAWLWYRYLEDNRPLFAVLTALAISAAVWTKQTAIVLILWFLLEALFKRRWNLLRRREILLCLVLGIGLLTPVAALTLAMDDYNLSQSVGVGYEGPDPRTGLSHFARIPRHLVRSQMTKPVLALSLVGMLVSLRRRDEKAVFIAAGIAVVYLFYALIVVQDPRYTLLLIPLLTVFAGIGLVALAHLWPGRSAPLALAVLALAGWQAFETYRMPLRRATGYDTTARYVLEHSTSPVVMFDGFNNGYFTYFMRAFDPKRSMWVLRGDKVLTSYALLPWRNSSLEVHAENEAEIQEILDRFGVEYVVVEQRDVLKIEVHQLLRRYLESGPFDLELVAPVEGTRLYLEDQKLLVYRYRDADAPRVSTIEIPVPLVGRIVTAPWPSTR